MIFWRDESERNKPSLAFTVTSCKAHNYLCSGRVVGDRGGPDQGVWDVYYIEGFGSHQWGAIRIVGPNGHSSWNRIIPLLDYINGQQPDMCSAFSSPSWWQVAIPAVKFLMETGWITVRMHRPPDNKTTGEVDL